MIVNCFNNKYVKILSIYIHLYLFFIFTLKNIERLLVVYLIIIFSVAKIYYINI